MNTLPKFKKISAPSRPVSNSSASSRPVSNSSAPSRPVSNSSAPCRPVSNSYTPRKRQQEKSHPESPKPKRFVFESRCKIPKSSLSTKYCCRCKKYVEKRDLNKKLEIGFLCGDCFSNLPCEFRSTCVSKTVSDVKYCVINGKKYCVNCINRIDCSVIRCTKKCSVATHQGGWCKDHAKTADILASKVQCTKLDFNVASEAASKLRFNKNAEHVLDVFKAMRARLDYALFRGIDEEHFTAILGNLNDFTLLYQAMCGSFKGFDIKVRKDEVIDEHQKIEKMKYDNLALKEKIEKRKKEYEKEMRELDKKKAELDKRKADLLKEESELKELEKKLKSKSDLLKEESEKKLKRKKLEAIGKSIGIPY